jgi:hypothetical protein
MTWLKSRYKKNELQIFRKHSRYEKCTPDMKNALKMYKYALHIHIKCTPDITKRNSTYGNISLSTTKHWSRHMIIMYSKLDYDVILI